MTALVTDKLRDLAATLADLKVRVRTAIASELGRTIGAAVRDVLMVALTHRLAVPARPAYADRWSDEDERDRWGEPRPPRDPWDDPETGERYPSSPSHDQYDSPPAVPAAAAVAVGVHVGRWWLSRHGGLTGAVAAGVLVASLGLASGPVARAAPRRPRGDRRRPDRGLVTPDTAARPRLTHVPAGANSSSSRPTHSLSRPVGQHARKSGVRSSCAPLSR